MRALQGGATRRTGYLLARWKRYAVIVLRLPLTHVSGEISPGAPERLSLV